MMTESQVRRLMRSIDRPIAKPLSPLEFEGNAEFERLKRSLATVLCGSCHDGLGWHSKGGCYVSECGCKISDINLMFRRESHAKGMIGEPKDRSR